MKSHTDLEQSKKLAEFLPLESADMSYSFNFDSGIYEISTTPYKSWVVPKYAQPDNGFGQIIPVWSSSALLDILPQGTRLLKSATDNTYHCDCPKGNIDKWFDNPVDACYEVIIKLHKMNLL